jgi:crotonobetainyl-CoA:carnitine CoA-transferase CaiB-like acyl-CoA transferase
MTDSEPMEHPPLSGVRIVEVAVALSGPVASMRLAEFGAAVVKVESPGGDMTRKIRMTGSGLSPNFINANRGKRSIAVDLTTPEGREVLDRLLDTSDILIENWRDDRADHLDIDVELARRRNPRLIVGSVRGLAGEGSTPRRTYDSHVQAVVGLAASQGTVDKPEFIRLNLADRVAAMVLVQGVLAALFQRTVNGEGRRVVVTMAGAMLGFAWGDLFGDLTVTGHEPEQTAGDRSRLGMFARSRDARWLAYTPVRDDEWAALCRLAGKDELIEAYPTRDARHRCSNEISAGLAPWFAGLSRSDALTRLSTAGVPAAPVNSPVDVLDDPRLGGDLVGERQYPEIGAVREVNPMSTDGSPIATLRPAPLLGEHTDDILAELGYGADQVLDLRARTIVA